jgi:hypothetical protein
MIALAFGAGLAAGAVHVVSGPDHLAAVAPWALEGPAQRGAGAGLRWALGHAAGVAVAALVALFARELIAPAVLASWSERAVGVSLVVLGAMGLARAALRRERPGSPRTVGALGLVHGLAGSGHVLGVLGASVFAERAEAVAYLAGLLAGSTLAMVVFGLGLGAAGARARDRDRGAARALSACSSGAALAVGAFWLAAH